MAVLKCAIGLHDVIHLVDFDVLDERDSFVTESIDVFERSGIIGEQSLQ